VSHMAAMEGARAKAPHMGWQGGVASRSREILMPSPVAGVPRSSGYLRRGGHDANAIRRARAELSLTPDVT
jgi:hypothetical protein